MLTSPLPVVLNRELPVPLRVQLARQIRDLVTGGTLSAGDRLPSTRSLAADLDVSRAVVEQAYDQLFAEGWLETRRGAGTFVAAAALALWTGSSSGLVVPTEVRSRRGRASPTGVTGPRLIRFDTGTPWTSDRMEAGWRRAWREVSATTPPRGYPDARGLPELREALCRHLARTRGLTCSPEEVVLTHGTGDGLRHLLSVLPGGEIAVEDPGYRAAVLAAQDAGRTVRDVPVDDAGLDTDALEASGGGLGAVYVTPAHQHPLGVTMSAARRVALLDRARAAGAVVVEDDYDSEFRYDVAPLPALAALDRDRVVYLGTASKAVSPGLRLGWLVGPAALVADLTARRQETHDVTSWPVQRAYLAMLQDGYVDRRVRAARRVYAARGALVRERLGGLGATSAAAGMYVTLALTATRERAAATAARQAGYDVPVLSAYTRSAKRHGLVLGFGGCTDAQLDGVLDVLATALEVG